MSRLLTTTQSAFAGAKKRIGEQAHALKKALAGGEYGEKQEARINKTAQGRAMLRKIKGQ